MKLKYFIAIILVILFGVQSFGQNRQLYLNVFCALQKVDERLVGGNYSNIIKRNKDNPPDLTRHIGIGVGAKFKLYKKIYINSGFNYSFERNNYIRDLNYQYFLPPPNLLLRKIIDIYVYHLIGNNTGFGLELGKRFLIGININSFFRFKSIYYETVFTDNVWVWNKKDFFSVEILPLIGYRYKMMEMGLYYRLYNYKKLDRAIFQDYDTGFGAIINDYETYNLPKFGVSVKYWFNIFKKKAVQEEKPDEVKQKREKKRRFLK